MSGTHRKAVTCGVGGCVAGSMCMALAAVRFGAPEAGEQDLAWLMCKWGMGLCLATTPVMVGSGAYTRSLKAGVCIWQKAAHTVRAPQPRICITLNS